MKMIRFARSTDASAVVPLLFQAMQEIACKLAGTEDMAVVRPLFEYFFQQEGNQYSYNNTLVFEEDGRIGGMITAYDGALLDALREPVLAHIRTVLRHSYIPEKETEAGEYYLDSIAVSEDSRGRGIGRQLIAAAMERAKQEGHRYAGLLVSEENPSAQRLYERLGFFVKGFREFAGGRYKHMVKELI